MVTLKMEAEFLERTAQVIKCTGEPLGFRRYYNAGRRVLCIPYWRWRLGAFGRKSDIRFPAMITGSSRVLIGAEVTVWRCSRIEAISTESGGGQIRIGDGTSIHPYAHISAAICVEIGKCVLIAPGGYVTDHDHFFEDPSKPLISNGKVVASPTSIGDFVWIGERVMVLKGVRIGEHCVIGAGAIVTKDIPAYSVALGAPARVVRQYSFKERRWVPAGDAAH